ncbi:MAG TPA: hypothetical protein VK964_10725 [Nocardioidaceae bacterium]|nr:hypothetical protein [Nocardioidaceae bacterium]
MPATSSAICTRNAVSSAEELIALARITGIVTLLHHHHDVLETQRPGGPQRRAVVDPVAERSGGGGHGRAFVTVA